MSANPAFKRWIKKGRSGVIEHRETCHYRVNASTVPIDECHCDCKAHYTFAAGYNAAKRERL